MKEYIRSVINEKENGLFFVEVPTGIGKTHAVADVINDYLKSDDSRKIIYITTLKKNIPVGEVLNAFGNDEVKYNENVLELKSNFDEVTSKILTLDIPEEFKTETYQVLVRLVNSYCSIPEGMALKKEYEQRIIDLEPRFRHEIQKHLKSKFINKELRINAIKTSSKYSWIGKLYPAVFTDEKRVLMMTVSKFMKKNSTIVEPSYRILQSKLLENAIIFIDEFDGTKATIKSEIIENSLKLGGKYLPLFKQISDGLEIKNMSKELADSLKEYDNGCATTYKSEYLLKEIQNIQKDYYTNLDFKTLDNDADQKQNFLLKDATYHSILQNGKIFIRSWFDEDMNRVNISYKNYDEYISEKQVTDINIFTMLRSINKFLVHFKIFIENWAKIYMKNVNNNRANDADKMTIENAISTLLNALYLDDNQQRILLEELCNVVAISNEKLLRDNSFYNNGLELFSLLDDDSHNTRTDLLTIRIFNTAEKVLCYIINKATVFAISATGELKSATGNYDLDYISTKLEKKVHFTSELIKDNAASLLEQKWVPYRNGDIQICGHVIDDTIPFSDLKKEKKELFASDELYSIAYNMLENTVENPFRQTNYFNAFLVMVDFFKNKTLKSFLYISSALPSDDNGKFGLDILQKLFDIAKQVANETEGSIVVLRSANFDADKEKLLERLANNEKIFVFSSYATISAGQNLQYKVQNYENLILLDNNKDDDRTKYKDFDAIYLANIRNIVSNIYSDERITEQQLLGMLFQIEELKEHCEISFNDAYRMFKTAFNAYIGNVCYEQNLLYESKSIRAQITGMVLQAVGRLTRTYVKNSSIYIYIEKGLLSKLDISELDKRILPPEMEKIKEYYLGLGIEYNDAEEFILNKAEKISSYANWGIKQTLSRNWTTESMSAWVKLRECVLRKPTIDCDSITSDSNYEDFYITSGEKTNKYLYIQESDFSSTIINFSMDKIGFVKSKRVNEKHLDNCIINEVSEENSGLTTAMKYKGLKEYFESMEYATSFVENEYIMAPVLFHNIYKGALGEVAGSYILEQELNLQFKEINDPDKFEMFDYLIAEDVYVDFKNWKFTYSEDRKSVMNEIRQKMDAIGARRVYIINLIGSPYLKGTETNDNRIIEIPGLIDENGKVIIENLKLIKEEDLNGFNK